jgi:hypothetical protein
METARQNHLGYGVGKIVKDEWQNFLKLQLI